MKMVEFIRPILFAGGLFFIIVGLNIAITENTTYEPQLAPLYTVFVYTFYLYMVFLFLTVLIGALEALVKLKEGKSLFKAY